MTNDSQRTFHTTSAPYMLPNDATDHDRLKLQNQGINEMMHNQPNHAPLHAPQRILDVGCGTGIQTRHFAAAYPSATEIIGLDLSPVPDEPNTPAQVSFLQGDIHTLATSPAHPQISRGGFDYIFSRMLVYGMTDWPGYIAKAKDLLCRGGWLEIQDMEFSFTDDSGRVLSDDWEWMQIQTEAWMQRGLDLYFCPKLEGYLREAGFVDVQVRKFRSAWAVWAGHPETDKIAYLNTTYNTKVNAVALRKILGGSKEPEELERIVQQMMKDLDGSVEGGHYPFWVVWARKP